MFQEKAIELIWLRGEKTHLMGEREGKQLARK